MYNSQEYATANSTVNSKTVFSGNSFKQSNKKCDDKIFGVASKVDKPMFFRMKKPDNVKNMFESQISFS